MGLQFRHTLACDQHHGLLMTSFTEKYWGGGGGPELAVFDKVSYNRTPDKSVY